MTSGTSVTITQIVVGVLVLVAAILMYSKTLRNEGSQMTNDPVKVFVNTTLGRIQGIERDIGNSRVILSFKGIPYAKPPVGDLRFKDPVPIDPWTGVKGTQTPPSCPQLTFFLLREGEATTQGKEDCLTLNVYTPKRSDSAPLPVMVFIHGGGFTLGDGEIFGGTPNFLLTKDIILVAIQYRIGVLGFLSTEDEILPGNYGMKDQTLALRWVQNHIGNFGGDASRVTIFGQSAGGASVHLHVLSPYSKGLFQSAIMMSGTALSPFATRNDHIQKAVLVASWLGCPGFEEESFDKYEDVDSSKIFACLMSKSMEDIISKTKDINNVWNRYPFTMVPRVDGDFLPEEPAQLLKDGKFNKVNLMGGITQHENHIKADDIMNGDGLNQALRDKFFLVGPLVVGMNTEVHGVYIADRLFMEYTDEILNIAQSNGLDRHFITNDTVDAVGQLFSDAFFNMNMDESLLLHLRYDSEFSHNIYAYEFQFLGKDSIMEAFGMTTKYVSHSCDLPFLFNNVLGLPDSQDPQNVFVRDIMVQLFTDFAIYGNPTPDLSLGFKWLPIKDNNLHHLAINPAPDMEDDKRVRSREFWKCLPTKNNRIIYSDEDIGEDDCTGL